VGLLFGFEVVELFDGKNSSKIVSLKESVENPILTKQKVK